MSRMTINDYLAKIDKNYYENQNYQELTRMLKNVASLKSRAKSMSKTAKYNECLLIESIIKQNLSKYKDNQQITLTTEYIQSVTSDEEITKIVKNIQSQKCLAKQMSKNDKYQKMLELEEIAKTVRSKIIPSFTKTTINDKLQQIEYIKQQLLLSNSQDDVTNYMIMTINECLQILNS